MIFLFNKDEEKNTRYEEFEKLKEIVKDVPKGIYAGVYEEGERDDKDRIVDDGFLEVLFVIGKDKREGMYRIRKKSERQRREIERWIEQGFIRRGHINRQKYKSREITNI